MVMEGLQEDMGEGSMLCTDHPFKNTTPAGGICAFCLQEKLGKLVSSSFPIAVFPSSSSSSSPSFRSDIGGGNTTAGGTTTSSTIAPQRPTSLLSSNIQVSRTTTSNECHYHQYYSKRSRILYLLSQKKKKKKDLNIVVDGGGGGAGGPDRSNNVVFKRSKSTATPRRGRGGLHFMGVADNSDDLSSPHKHRGFWSFLYLQKHHSSSRKTLTDIPSNSLGASTAGSCSQAQRSRQDRDFIVVEENESPDQATFDRKVSRSRSVGCGSRSFSGDFFERISTGFGDCTLRRVESQREGKSKAAAMRGSGGQDCIKERVRCGGLFSGFMITSSSSSSSSSSYWVSSNPNEVGGGNTTGKVTSATPSTVAGGHHHHQLAHGRSKSWGWAFASPIRAFSKPSSSASKREAAGNKNQAPNLAAIPSLLSVRS